MTLKSIYSRKIATELQERGFEIVKIGINPYHPNYNVFFFKKTPELLQAFEELMKACSCN